MTLVDPVERRCKLRQERAESPAIKAYANLIDQSLRHRRLCYKGLGYQAVELLDYLEGGADGVDGFT